MNQFYLIKLKKSIKIEYLKYDIFETFIIIIY
jgi:hypothetical protein